MGDSAQRDAGPLALSSQLLGFGAASRVLIINCDDLGMHESVNAGVMRAIEHGVASSCSLLVAGAAAPQAMQLLRRAPAVPFGIHLTLTRDDAGGAPVAPPAQVASLLDSDGQLFAAAARGQLLAQARLDEVERELRAQIRVVAAAGLTPTHLDWHCLADGGRLDITDLTIQLAQEHGLAARVWLGPVRRAARRRGLPVVDHDFLDSFALDVDGKHRRYVELLRALPAGLSEWAVHPALADQTPAVDLGWTVRHTDYDFLVSPLAHRIIAEEGVVVIDYRRVQSAWRRVLADGLTTAATHGAPA